MMQYVALLRGIGPSNPNMRGDKLKAFFEGLGFLNVQTVLGSGNVIFQSVSTNSNSLSEQIEYQLPEKLGFNSVTILRTQSELQTVLDQNPFKGQEEAHNKGTYHLITFFKDKPTISFALPHTPDGKPFTILSKGNNEIYGSINLTSGKTPDYMTWLERQFGKTITSRTPKTIQLIVNKMNMT